MQLMEIRYNSREGTWLKRISCGSFSTISGTPYALHHNPHSITGSVMLLTITMLTLNQSELEYLLKVSEKLSEWKCTYRFLVSVFVFGVRQDKIDMSFAISEIHRIIVLLQIIDLKRKKYKIKKIKKNCSKRNSNNKFAHVLQILQLISGSLKHDILTGQKYIQYELFEVLLWDAQNTHADNVYCVKHFPMHNYKISYKFLYIAGTSERVQELQQKTVQLSLYTKTNKWKCSSTNIKTQFAYTQSLELIRMFLSTVLNIAWWVEQCKSE